MQNKCDNKNEPIAIIGIGCRFPGQANNASSFWNLLCHGVDAIGEIPPDRWNIDTYYHPVQGTPAKTYSRWGGFVEGIDQFEPECFGISPREAVHMDPQQRMLLEVTREAIDDAALVAEELSEIRTGVFIGISTYDYAQIHYGPHDWASVDPHSATGGASSIAANRISYCFNFQGPSLAVDTACSSSLVALDLACKSLWAEECDVALSGGVNAIISPGPFIAFCAASMLSPEGRCKTFDAGADGFVRGEGAGIVALKPLSKALSHGDPIYALIIGTAVNHDGRTSGIAFPSEKAQKALVVDACRNAGVSPEEIDFVEAHGTGTAIGDPIEARALGTVLSVGRFKELLIGSSKTNVGHLEAAAGIVGLIKTALSLKHRTIPPNLHFNNPNPAIDFRGLSLRVPRVLQPWPENPWPATAGVNSFGFGGTNAHAVLREYVPDDLSLPRTRRAGRSPWLLPLSARSKEALEVLAGSYEGFLGASRERGEPPLDEICYTATTGRSHLEHRLALVGATNEQFSDLLAGFRAGETRPGLASGRRLHGRVPKIVFVCAGQGPQWWAMGRQLLAEEPVFRAEMERCADLIDSHVSWSLFDELTASEARSRIQQTDIAQPALFALQVALAAVWDSWGIRPSAVVGHSVGEVAAAYLCGALTLEDAVRVIVYRGQCMERANSKGQMLAVGLPPLDAERVLTGYEKVVSLAAVNSPSSATLSGDSSALEAIARSLDQQGVFCRFLQVGYAFHSPQMEPVREPLLESLDGLKARQAHLPMISTVTGEPAEGTEFGKDYWWLNVRKTVRFASAVERLLREGYDTFVELSPHPVLAGPLSECQAGPTITILPSLRRGEDEREVLLGSLGKLYTMGHPVNWETLWPGGGGHVRLPGYPWQKRSYWHESEDSRQARLGKRSHVLLGHRQKSADPTWESRIDLRVLPYLNDHQVQGSVVVPATAYIEMALAAGVEIFGEQGCTIEELRFERALFIDRSGESPRIQFTFYPEDASFAIQSTTGTSTSWMVHATGYLQKLTQPAPQVSLAPQALRETFETDVSPRDLYAIIAAFDLRYGPSFQGMERVWRRDGEALARVLLPRHLRSEADAYCLHPALLDACFQPLVAAFPLELGKKNRNLFLPVQFGRVRFYQSPKKQSVWSHLQLTRVTERIVDGHFRLYDDEGKILAALEEFRCQAVEEVRLEDAMERWLYQVQWYHKPLSGVRSSRPAVDYVPSSKVMLAPLARQTGTRSSNRRQKGSKTLNEVALAYLIQGLQSLGFTWQPGEQLALSPSTDGLKSSPEQSKRLGRLLDQLERGGYLHKEGNRKRWVVTKGRPVDPQALWLTALSRHPAYLAELNLVGRAGSRLPALLQCRKNADALVSEARSASAEEHLYHHSPSYGPLNKMVEQVVGRALKRLPTNRPLRVLEAGAGTGGLTSHILPLLPPNRCAYYFTDKKEDSFDRAQPRFRNFSFVEYRSLDLDRDPLHQGYDAGDFDLVLASEVLHNTASPAHALTHLQTLLAPGGLLLFLERETAPLWHELVFGLSAPLEGSARAASRPRSRSQWKSLLQETGYRDVACTPGLSQRQCDGFIMVGRKPGVELANAPYEGAFLETQPHGSWLIFADRRGLASELGRRLESRGEKCTWVTPAPGFRQTEPGRFEVRADSAADMERLVRAVIGADGSSWRGAVHLWAVDAPPLETASLGSLREYEALGCYSVLHLVQAIGKLHAPARGRLLDLFLVTRGAQPAAGESGAIGGVQAPLLGLGRVLVNEHPEIHCKMIDVDPHRVAIDSLLAELLTDDAEEEVALRGEGRFVPRLERTKLRAAKTRRGSRRAFRAVTPRSGVMDHLTLRETERQAPGPGQVEIEVWAAALNFRDVMKALGLYPADTGDDFFLGDECAGRIVAIGKGLPHLSLGDEVIAIAPGSLGSHTTTMGALTLPKPREMSFAEATTLPVAYATASFALLDQAHLHRGERVLIHSAAGGVGLAALQIARRIGAEVFATAGNPEKREFLQRMGIHHVMDSRTLSFAEEIMELTNGRGVDVVLNALAGKAIAKGVSCLAPYGRFVEIGKRDIYQNSKLGLSAFRKNLSFSAIDLGRLMMERQEDMRSLLVHLSRMLKGKALGPLPHRVFPASQLVDAFRYMAQARHVGKVVVSLEEHDIPTEANLQQEVTFKSDATYLVTGGLGGVGRKLAQWMVSRGARHMVLMGRNGAESGEAKATVKELRRKGATVVVAKGDVTDPRHVRRIFQKIDRTLPPLRGIFHAAMVLDDGVVLQLTPERFRRAMAPKVDGVWNLHCETRKRPLDHFVLFSSVSSLVGNQGQANYVAANTFLDTFASYRRSLGLPAMSINWGHLSGMGYVSRRQQLAETLTRRGIVGISPEQTFEALGSMLRHNPVQMGVMRIEWQKLASATSHTKRMRRLSALIMDDSPQQEGQDDAGMLRDKLTEAAGEEREALLRDYMVDQVARVLGTSASKLDADQPLSDLGLDSLMGVEIKNRIERDLSVSLPTGRLLQDTVTVNRLCGVALELLSAPRAAVPALNPAVSHASRNGSRLVRLREGNTHPALFCIHSAEGQVRIYEELAERLPFDQPVYGIQASDGNGTSRGSMEELAAEYARFIYEEQPHGSYCLLGFSLGGLIALTIAQILEQRGHNVALVGLVDCDIEWSEANYPKHQVLSNFILEMYARIQKDFDILKSVPDDQLLSDAAHLAAQLMSLPEDERTKTIVDWVAQRGYLNREVAPVILEQYFSSLSSQIGLVETFTTRPLRAPLSVWWAGQSGLATKRKDWCRYTTGRVVETTIDATHFNVMDPPHVHVVAAEMSRTLEGLRSS